MQLAPMMTDDEFFDFCARSPEFRIERTVRGEIVIRPPGGLETGSRGAHVAMQLGNWAHADGRGKAVAHVEYMLPSGAALAPSYSWVANSRIATLTREQREKFPRLCPEFVVELMSPSERLKGSLERMGEWIENGVQLGWLLDADKRTAYIYRPGREPEVLVEPQRLEGEGPVAGFVLELKRIWSKL